ncbi:MAG: hypothetical protein DI547_04790 [Sphingobium sp.]|nr:MAG: hypothetical protein DI547_04790 [Sphingobium sp.]
MIEFTSSGKQVLRDGKHFADSITEEAAALIVAGLNARASIAAYLDSEADRRKGPMRLAWRAAADAVKARFDEGEGK